MGNNKTKNIILAVLVVGIVSMTIAFAALTQQLNITDNVATVSSNWRVRFAPTVTTSVGTTIAGTTTGATYTSNTPTVTNDQQTITGLQATFTKPGDYVEVAFTVRNEGNIAAKGQGVTLSLGNLTCAPGSGSSVSQEAANTFCTKLVKWVKHSDRVTDWTSADTLAAYSGSGAYPSIDGILRIEYPSTLSNSDISAISGGSIVVTLGDTTLHFEQDDNVTASSNSGSGSGGSDSGEQNGSEQIDPYSMAAMCPGCVFGGSVLGYDEYSDSYSEFEHGFSAYILNENTEEIESSFVCGFNDDNEVFCLSGNSSKFSENVNILKHFYDWDTQCADYSDDDDADCRGSSTYGRASSEGNVDAGDDSVYCTYQQDYGISCS